MPVLPRPTSLMTVYLPILSGMRATGFAAGTDVLADNDMARVSRDGASGYGLAPTPDCDAPLTRPGSVRSAQRAPRQLSGVQLKC